MKGMKKMSEIIYIPPFEQKAVYKKRAAIYARVSTESERLINSLSAQINCYIKQIQQNPQWLFAGVYVDKGITGTRKENRNGFKKMIADCENGKIDIILVKSISRFSRNTVDLLETIRRLKELGIEVRFEKENINSMSNDGEFMLSVLASFAQEESRSISENIKWGTRKRFEKGIPNGRVRVFGYKWRDTKLEIIDNEAIIVKRIYGEYLKGKSPRKIAEGLNNENVTTRSGCNWSDFGIRYILTNITYTGNMILQKVFIDDCISKHRKINRGELPGYFVENTHEPIIDKLIFDKVQNEIRLRSKIIRDTKK